MAGGRETVKERLRGEGRARAENAAVSRKSTDRVHAVLRPRLDLLARLCA